MIPELITQLIKLLRGSLRAQIKVEYEASFNEEFIQFKKKPYLIVPEIELLLNSMEF